MSTADNMYRHFELQAQNETLTRRVQILEDTLRFTAMMASMQLHKQKTLVQATNVLLDTIDACDSEQILLTSSHPAVWAVSEALDKLENGTQEEPKL